MSTTLQSCSDLYNAGIVDCIFLSLPDTANEKEMLYKEFIPGDALKPYVKCYYIFESDANAVVGDKAFATGCVEIMFNMGTGTWQTASDAGFATTPAIELWGQIIRPLAFRSLKKNSMLGIRFYPHTASVFLNTNIGLFNDHVTDLTAITGRSAHTLHERLMDAPSLKERIQLIEAFLLKRLSLFEKKLDKIVLVGTVMSEMKRHDFYDNIENLASRYGLTSRYLQKMFLQYTGLTPKLYSKINRFQNSLQLVAKGNLSLTSIAYECGYFDQSHFIREFRSFTGLTPSAFNPKGTSAILASPS